MLRKPHMFSKIFDLGLQRTRLQAVGFYIAHLCLYLILVGLLMGFLIAPGLLGTSFEGQVEGAAMIGPALGLIHALVMTVLMLKAKNMQHDRKMIAIGAGAILIGGLGGPLLSLLVISWLSTRMPEPAPVSH